MDEAVPSVLPVDNVAHVFIPNFSAEDTTFSRIAVRLQKPPDRPRLQDAFEAALGRFPYFRVYLKSCVFGYVLERTDDLPLIEEDGPRPNNYADFLNRKYLIRVKTSGRTVAVETSHILTDGFGTLRFLVNMLSGYYRESFSGTTVSISEEEWRCAFRQKFLKKRPFLGIPVPAYHPEAEPIGTDKYFITRIVMDTDEVRLKSAGMKVTLNSYLTAVYTAALQNMFFEDLEAGRARRRSTIRIAVPADLRRAYPSQCMRNFTYPYTPVFRPAEKRLSFEELVELISGTIKSDRENGVIEGKVARNLRIEDNLLFRITPGRIRRSFFKIAYRLLGRRLYSGVITNLGEIIMPDCIAGEIESLEILPSNTRYPGRNTAVHSYRGRLVMEIGSSCDDLRLEHEVLKILDKLNIRSETEYIRE